MAAVCLHAADALVSRVRPIGLSSNVELFFAMQTIEGKGIYGIDRAAKLDALTLVTPFASRPSIFPAFNSMLNIDQHSSFSLISVRLCTAV